MNKLEKVVYTAHATATGGRDGRGKSSDGRIDVVLKPPKEMGGTGEGVNPEQLFAVGYAACFIGAVKFVAGQEKAARRRQAAHLQRVHLERRAHLAVHRNACVARQKRAALCASAGNRGTRGSYGIAACPTRAGATDRRTAHVGTDQCGSRSIAARHALIVVGR